MFYPNIIESGNKKISSTIVDPAIKKKNVLKTLFKKPTKRNYVLKI